MKKVFAFIMALAMCLTVLAGCGSKEEPAADPVKPAASAKPGAAQPAAAPAAPAVSGEMFDAGNVMALAPEGWKAFPATDAFAEEPDTMDPDVINICKGGETDFDLFSKPFIRIDYYGPDTEMMGGLKDWYDNTEDLPPMQCGPYTWEGFTTTDYGLMAILTAEDGDHQYQASIYLETDGGSISLEDEDVQAILASVAPSDGSAGSGQSAGSSAAPVQAEATGPYAWWAGDWFGWWCAYSCGGDYEPLEDMAWPAFATIELTGEDTGMIHVWDSETGNGKYIATAEISFGDGTTAYGSFMSENGTFFDTDTWITAPVDFPPAEIAHADWITDPGASTVSQFDQMIEIEGRYEDPNDDDNRIDYYFFLRPWGMEWEDVRNGDTEGCVYDDMMPLYYDDWYIPLLNMGASMPATFAEGSAMLGGAPASDPATTPEPQQTQAASGSSAPSGFGGEHTATIEEFMTDIPVDFSFTLPESGWVLEVYGDSTIYLYNVPTPDETHSAAPRIQFELKENLEKIDFYKDDFENLKNIDSRTIGGIEMQGRTYKDVGMEWTEYYGELPNGLWVSIKISGVGTEPGTEGSAILDSVRIG